MIDETTLSDEIFLAADRVRFIVPPRQLSIPVTIRSDADIALRAADLAITMAIHNAPPFREAPMSSITPFNWQQSTPTYSRICRALEQITQSSRFDEPTLRTGFFVGATV